MLVLYRAMAESVPRIFDRKALARARARALKTKGDNFLAREAAEGLADRLSAVNRKFEHAAQIDGADLAATPIEHYAGVWTRSRLADDEALDLASCTYDLAVSVLGLHAVNDLPGVLVQVRRALKPDGLFMAALFGGSTLHELRDALAFAEAETRGGASPRVAPFADVRDLGGLLQRAGFALPVADVERTVARYSSFAMLVEDLRALGETNVLEERSRRPLPRDVLAAALRRYAEKHADSDGKLRATFDIIYLTGWAPHESQQRPLAPGSARTRLADALGTKEKPAGESTGPRRQN
jgi:SAM-dependent methyltransferase